MECPLAREKGSKDKPKKKKILLRNYQTDEAYEVSGPVANGYEDCRHQVCHATFMELDPYPEHHSSKLELVDEVQSGSVDYIRKEAYDYQLIYHRENETTETDYHNRLKDIDVEIETNGIYTHTTSELEYGCRLAWRNSSRCINRLYWETLTILDKRHVKTNDEMFKEICHHLDFAYNDGKLRATVLVLPVKARMWSTQYFRYACYEQVDGSILGDPANLELTRAAMKIGWNKKQEERTEWDLLPIIVQCDPNEPANWYEIPENLKHEIYLSHPDVRYDTAIKQLGLRWFAQPYVCNKAIEIGGIAYKCVPFSGWFMGTEIGRDLCDKQRYDVIPKLATLLNLDVKSTANSTMNIDRIYVEVNAAVLHSYQQNKVTIVDHHTASANFMKFMSIEIKHRGNVPADWVWLVPPISSGMSSLFHQEMLNYVLKPRILDQTDPWINYYPFMRQQKMNSLSAEIKRRNYWLTLRAVRAIIGFALVAAKSRPMVTVLYASMSGIAQSYAEQMTKRLNETGFRANLLELDNYTFECTNPDIRSVAIIITSTHGQGNAPINGRRVEKWLLSSKEKNNSSIAPQNLYDENFQTSKKKPMRWCNYAVCAIGSSAYPLFCGFGKLIDQTFKELGAKQLIPMVTCDILQEQYRTYNEWEKTIIKTIRQMYPQVSFNEVYPTSLPKSVRADAENTFFVEQLNLSVHMRPAYIKLEFYPNDELHHNPENVGQFSKESPFNASVLQNIELVNTHNSISTSFINSSLKVAKQPTDIKRNNDHSVRLLVLGTPSLFYCPGDHVCIFPENNIQIVNNIIERCELKSDKTLLDVPCSLKSLTHNRYQTIRQILTSFVDLNTTLRPHVLKILVGYAEDTREQRKIFELSKGEQRYNEWILNSPTVSETLREFPSIKIPLNELIQLLPPIQPRYYSISSSYNHCPNELHISVSVVSYKTKDGRLREGLCSNYLKQTKDTLSADSNSTEPSRVGLFLIPNTHFRLPGQESLDSTLVAEAIKREQSLMALNCPILMFAVGSGIAPFRSFWQELQFLSKMHPHKSTRRMLFIGCRTPDDCIYANELYELVNQSKESAALLEKVVPVFSREHDGVKRYVQDVMLEYEDAIYSILTTDNSHVYICGSVKACQGIESSLASIYQYFEPSTEDNNFGINMIKNLKETGRLKLEMFG